MTSKLNRERLEKIKSWRETYGAGSNVMLPAEEAEELACLALAAMESEPVAFTEKHEISNMHATGLYLRAWPADRARNAVEGYTIPLYRHAQPVPEYPEVLPCSVLLEPGLRFGKGIKTSTMLAALARRAVHESDMAALSPEERAEFQARIEDFKALIAHPAPVVPENCVTAEHRRVIEMLLNVCGAAFELADDSCQQDVDGEDCHVVPDDAFQKLSDALDEIENTLPTEDIDRPDVFLAWSAMPRAALKSLLQAQPVPVVPDVYVRDEHGRMMLNGVCEPKIGFGTGWNACRAAMLAAAPQSPGSEPATVPGKWIPVSERMPDREVDVQVYCPDKKEQMVAYLERNELEGYFRFATWRTGDGIYCQPTHWMQLPAGPQEVTDGK